MTEIKSYKDLLIWQKGMDIVKDIYLLCESFPTNEVFGLQSQLKRSAISIPSNIAEGYGRQLRKSYLHFLRISRGSLFELETQIILAKDLNFISEESYNKIIKQITEESKMLNSYIKSLSKLLNES